MEDLRARRCVPCEGGVPKLGTGEIAKLAPQVPGWSVDGERLRRKFVFRNFVEAMRFVNKHTRSSISKLRKRPSEGERSYSPQALGASF